MYKHFPVLAENIFLIKSPTHKVYSIVFGLFLLMSGIQESQAQLQTGQPLYTGPENEKITINTDTREVFVTFNRKVDLELARSLSSKFPSLSLSEEMPLFEPVNGIRFSYAGADEDLEPVLKSLRKMRIVSSAYPGYEIQGDPMYIHSDVLIKPLSGFVAFSLRNQLAARGLEVVKSFDLGLGKQVWQVRVPADQNTWAISQEFQEYPEVVFAVPDMIALGSYDVIPNDTLFADQWFLDQSNDADIDAPEAWNVTTGDGSVVVAVIDGAGYDLSHPDLTGKVVSPYDAVNDDNDPEPAGVDPNHGTPCAGLIAAATNNTTGVAGVGYNIKVKPVVIGFNNGGGSFSTSSTILLAAISNIIVTSDVVAVSNSYSVSGFASNAAIITAFDDLNTNCRNGLGAVVLGSAGNSSSNSTMSFPGSAASTVSVGASSQSDVRAGFSNYGLTGNGLDVMAPGRSLKTLDRSGADGYNTTDYTDFTGTSASCPVAAGIVGLMASVDPTLTGAQYEAILKATCDKVNTGIYSYGTQVGKNEGTWNDQMGYGRVNAFRAVSACFATAVCKDIVVSLDNDGGVKIDPADVDGGSSHRCGMIDSMVVSLDTFSCSEIGVNAVSFIVIDTIGLRDTCQAKVTVEDNTPPTVRCKGPIILIPLDSSGVATVEVSRVDNGSSDNCGIDSLWLSDTRFDCTFVLASSFPSTKLYARDPSH
jgi:subtilisin family serine protease